MLSGKSGKWTEEDRERIAVEVEEPPSKKARVTEEQESDEGIKGNMTVV